MKLAEGKVDLAAIPKIKPLTPPSRRLQKTPSEPANAAD